MQVVIISDFFEFIIQGSLKFRSYYSDNTWILVAFNSPKRPKNSRLDFYGSEHLKLETSHVETVKSQGHP